MEEMPIADTRRQDLLDSLEGPAPDRGYSEVFDLGASEQDGLDRLRADVNPQARLHWRHANWGILGGSAGR